MKYNTFIFDLDGTLLDTLKDLQVAVNHALKKFGYAEKTYEQIRAYVGNGIAKLIERSVPDGLKNENFEKISKEFFNYYEQHISDYTLPYNNIMDMLKKLKESDCVVAVVSNKSDDFVKSLCGQFFEGYIDIAIGETSTIRRKPYSDMVDYVLNKLGKSKEECVYIGDSEVDIQTAKNSGLDCICVSWGFRDKEHLIKNGANIVIDSPIEVMDYIV